MSEHRPAAPVIDKRDQPASHYALLVLLLAYILSFIDRNILSLLVGPIRETFDISDLEFSFLHGLAFTLFYIFLGLPIGWLADRYSRQKIITFGVFFWSLMTAACGLAKSFAALFVARIGVGVGEATLSPATYSLLSDLYSPRNLKWAVSIFAMGITLGSGISYMVGGWLIDYLSLHDVSALPVIGAWAGQFAPWQLTFMAVGLPGLLVVLMLLLVKEPPRVPSAHESADPMPLKEVITYLKSHWQVYGSIMGAVSLMAIIGYGTLIWFPEFLLRTYQLSKTEGGAAIGSIFIFAGTAGTFSGALFSEFLQKRGYTDSNVRVLFLAAAAAAIPAIAMPLMPEAQWALWLAVPVIFIHYTHFGVAMAGLQLVTPNRMRAQVSALLLFVANLFGLALGGSFIASFTDLVFRDDNALCYSLATVAALCYPLAALLMGWGLKHYRQALAQFSNQG